MTLYRLELSFFHPEGPITIIYNTVFLKCMYICIFVCLFLLFWIWSNFKLDITCRIIHLQSFSFAAFIYIKRPISIASYAHRNKHLFEFYCSKLSANIGLLNNKCMVLRCDRQMMKYITFKQTWTVRSWCNFFLVVSFDADVDIFFRL